MSESWLEEQTEGRTLRLGLKIKETLFVGKSPYQEVAFHDTYAHGRAMALDGCMMVTERDEHFYHEMLVHVPLFTHPRPRRVLVVGGGDGGTIREILRHDSCEEAVLAELDGLVVELSRRHLPTTACALDDPRVTIRIGDGVAYLADQQDAFDVILLDLTDPVGQAARLFQAPFYRTVHRALRAGGIMVTQSESPLYHAEILRGILREIHEVFGNAHPYHFPMPTYPSGWWSCTLASKGPHPLRDARLGDVARRSFQTKHYNEETHRAAFALPPAIRALLP